MGTRLAVGTRAPGDWQLFGKPLQQRTTDDCSVQKTHWISCKSVVPQRCVSISDTCVFHERLTILFGKPRQQRTTNDSVWKTHEYRQITWRIIIQPDFCNRSFRKRVSLPTLICQFGNAHNTLWSTLLKSSIPTEQKGLLIKDILVVHRGEEKRTWKCGRFLIRS